MHVEPFDKVWIAVYALQQAYAFFAMFADINLGVVVVKIDAANFHVEQFLRPGKTFERDSEVCLYSRIAAEVTDDALKLLQCKLILS